jgi:hypothetical protein
MNHYFPYKDMPWDWKPILNNNPYTFNEWCILSLYGIFIYKLANFLAKKNTNISICDKTDVFQIEKPKLRCIVIVIRDVKSASVDREIRKQIAVHLKETGYTRPCFLSAFSNPDYNKIQYESRIAHETLNTFLIKLYKTNNSLVIMNRNDYEWEYEPYITLGKMNDIHIEMVYV